jgi:hypothetical protein
VSKDEAKNLTRGGASVVSTGLFLLLLLCFFVAMVGESLGESLQQWSDRKISRVLGLKKNWMGELDSVVQASVAAAT